MEAAPSCVFQKAAEFTAAADLVLHWLEMAGTAKVRNRTNTHAHAHTLYPHKKLERGYIQQFKGG